MPGQEHDSTPKPNMEDKKKSPIFDQEWGDMSPTSASETEDSNQMDVWGDLSCVNIREEAKQESEKDASMICRFFNTQRGCNKGDKCRYKHDKFACPYFFTDKGCRRALLCPFSHEESAVLNPELHECPNDGCTNLCKGKQCKRCHQNMGRSNAGSKPKWDDIPVRLCPECEVRFCKGKRCRECHFSSQNIQRNRANTSYDNDYS